MGSSDTAPPGPRRHFASLTAWSLAALLAGLLLGLAGHFSGRPIFSSVAAVTAVVGQLWIAALQMVALPLVFVLTLAALTRPRTLGVGALGVRAIAFFGVTLVVVAVLTLVVTSVLLARYSVAPSTIAAMNAGAVLSDSLKAIAPPPSVGTWLVQLIPRNIFAAAAAGQLLPLLLFTLLFAAAVARLPAEHRAPLGGLFEAGAQALLILIRWLLLVTPLGVFALSYGIGLRTGGALVGMLGLYLVVQPAMTLLCVGLFYLLTRILGRTTLRAFARAVAPAQLVAVSTRSSLAALPAMIQGGRSQLGHSAAATEFLLPFSVALFRVSFVISDPVKLVFLARVYGITLQPAAVAAFLVTVILFSFASSGTPNSGGGTGFRMVPVFVAAGIPLEGVLILEAMETIPDIFDTLVNVTSQMSAVTILSRRGGNGRVVIYFLVPAAGEFAIIEYLFQDRPALLDRFRIIQYEELAGLREFSRGTYVLAGLDQLTPGMQRLVTQLCDRLGSADGVRLLNHPRHSLRRFALLRTLHEMGLSDFGIARAGDDLGALRYPVFLRNERLHEGALSPLLSSAREVEQAIGRALVQGHPFQDLLVVEYCATVDSDGLFRKYAAFNVGNRIVARSLNHNRGWMVKHSHCEYTRPLVLEEQQYVQGNPHAARLAEIFAIAGIQYGRIDYAVKDGRIQTWEINLNATIGRGPGYSRSHAPAELQPTRDATRNFFFDRFLDAWVAVDSPASPEPPVLAGFDRATLQAAAGQQFPRARFRAALRRMLRPFKPLLEPLAAPFLGWLASGIRRLR